MGKKKITDQSWSSQINGNFYCEFFRSRTEPQNSNSAKNTVIQYTLGNLIHFEFNRPNNDFWTFLYNPEESNPLPNGYQHWTYLSFLINSIIMHLIIRTILYLQFYFLSIPLTSFLDVYLYPSGTHIIIPRL